MYLGHNMRPYMTYLPIPNNICQISISVSFRLKKTEKPWDRERLSHVTYRVCAVSIMTSSYNFITASCIKR